MHILPYLKDIQCTGTIFTLNKLQVALSMMQTKRLKIFRLNQSTIPFFNVQHLISYKSTLTELDLSGNRLTSLPSNISGLSHLVELNVSYNKLSSLPKSISALSTLKKLSVSYNQLDTIPKQFPSVLEFLLLKNNKLGAFSSHIIMSLKTIKKINLKKNLISKNEKALLQKKYGSIVKF